MQRALTLAFVSLALCACGDDEGTQGESEPTCAIGMQHAGDVQGTLSANEDVACLISHSFDSGIDVVYVPLRAVESVTLRIADVTEGESGSGFATSLGLVTEGDVRYQTTAIGCSATITEHTHETSETSEIGVLRTYHVVGTASCTEPALRADGMPGEISMSNVAFVVGAVWTD